MIEFDSTVVIVFILAYLIAYALNIVEIWSIVILFFVIYFIFTQISFDASDVGFDFTLEYYTKILMAQSYNYLTSLFGYDDSDGFVYPKIKTDFTHRFSGYNKPQSKREVHQSVGSTPIDIFNNGMEYIYIGGGKGQEDAILKPIYSKDGSKLKLKSLDPSITRQVSDKSSATYSAVSFDMTGNGVQDLIVSRQNGLVIYENRSLGNKVKFVKHLILEDYVFDNSAPIALCVGDVNLNGKPDILISQFTYPSKLKAFQFNNDKHWAPNILLENMSGYGRNTGLGFKFKFVDSTDKYNLTGDQNTFTSSFVVLDRDYSDNSQNNEKSIKPPQIINSNDTGKLEIYNPTMRSADKDGDAYRYSRLKTEDTTFPNGFWMGLAIGDVNNDGRLDIFSTNLGKDIPTPSPGSYGGTRGSEGTGLRPEQRLTHDHMLLMNRSDDGARKGTFKFQNVSDQAGLSKDAIGWGCAFEDFTLNGFLDLFYAQNYVDMTSITQYDSAVYMIQNGDKLSDKKVIPQFKKIKTMENPNYCHAPMFCDFGRTGLKDLVWVNIHGPLVGYRNTNILSNNFISIRLPKTIKYLNASVVLKFKGDSSIYQRQNIVGGIGLSGDQSSTMVFGLGKRGLDDVESVKLYSLYEPYVVDITEKVKLNQRIILV